MLTNNVLRGPQCACRPRFTHLSYLHQLAYSDRLSRMDLPPLSLSVSSLALLGAYTHACNATALVPVCLCLEAVCMRFWMYTYLKVCQCVCACARERVCVYVRARARVCMCARARVCVCAHRYIII